MTPDALSALLKPPAIQTIDRYEIRATVGNVFVARMTSTEGVAFIVPMKTSVIPGRQFGALSLSFPSSVQFTVAGKTWNSPAATLECSDLSLLRTFCALTCDVAQSLQGMASAVTARDIIARIADWERLLRYRRSLSDTEEIGLWGELFLIATARNPDIAVTAWQGPHRDRRDFFSGGVSLEVKTSFSRLRHHFSLAELDRPAAESRSYVACLWIAKDPAAGKTLPELIYDIDSVVQHQVSFEEKLMQSGYSRSDSKFYEQRLSCLEPPMIFPTATVPRVRTVDAGVLTVRFLAQLDPESALPDVDARVVLRAIGL